MNLNRPTVCAGEHNFPFTSIWHDFSFLFYHILDNDFDYHEKGRPGHKCIRIDIGQVHI